MKHRSLLAALTWFAFAAAAGIAVLPVSRTSAQSSFDQFFTGRTLRVDYYHSGTAETEEISLDRARLEGPWPGSRTRLLDTSNRGKYFVEIRSAESGTAVYSRGFASIFGEWETIGEARRGIRRTFHESLRLPEPRSPFDFILSKRGRDGRFQPFYQVRIDPSDRFVDRSSIAAAGRSFTLFENGDPARTVDILVLGDGYGRGESDKFRSDVKRLSGALFEAEPFRSRKADFSVRAIHVDSAESDITSPRDGRWRNTALGLEFNSFDLDRYVLTYRNREIREIAAQVPYDTLLIIFNSEKYGGGGIFGLWATCAADSSWASYVFVHEFGHSFGGLADEYYSSDVAYEDFTPPGTEPWEPNVTALLDPGMLKWKALATPGVPLPTPWDKQAYDKASAAYSKQRRELQNRQAPAAELAQLEKSSSASIRQVLESDSHFGKVGAFEGAAYEPVGLYRPSIDCIMFSKHPKEFCPVCRQAIEEMIDLYAK